MIDTVVIPAAGLGGRLIPATKEIPKIMLPIFQKKQKRTNVDETPFRNYI